MMESPESPADNTSYSHVPKLPCTALLDQKQASLSHPWHLGGSPLTQLLNVTLTSIQVLKGPILEFKHKFVSGLLPLWYGYRFVCLVSLHARHKKAKGTIWYPYHPLPPSPSPRWFVDVDRTVSHNHDSTGFTTTG